VNILLKAAFLYKLSQLSGNFLGIEGKKTVNTSINSLFWGNGLEIKC
jgi:hypothetical protein